MSEDIRNIGMQGNIGRGIDGMWTGSAVLGRRRWPRRDLEEVAAVEAEKRVRAPKKPVQDRTRDPEVSP